MRKVISLLLILYHLFVVVACYNHGQQTPDAWDLTKEQLDSISFSTTHHYTQGYNFVVTADTLVLYELPPVLTIADELRPIDPYPSPLDPHTATLNTQLSPLNRASRLLSSWL